MKISIYIIPFFILIVFILALIKKVNAYESFSEGVNKGIKSVLKIFPTMFLMYICINLLDISGILDNILKFKNIPNEVIAQTLFRPFSSQASLGMMLEVYKKYGVDSKAGFLSSLIHGGSDSSIYIITLYLSAYKINNTKKIYILGLLVNGIAFLASIIVYCIIFKSL